MKKVSKKETPKENVFSGANLIAAMAEGLAEMKKPNMGNLRVVKRELPDPIAPLSKAEIKKLRTDLGASQAVFARMLNVPKATAIAWETGARKPSGAALKLLDIARRHPDALLEA